jgi:hypothetical protein
MLKTAPRKLEKGNAIEAQRLLNYQWQQGRLKWSQEAPNAKQVRSQPTIEKTTKYQSYKAQRLLKYQWQQGRLKRSQEAPNAKQVRSQPTH